jgi:hypothetical protein
VVKLDHLVTGVYKYTDLVLTDWGWTQGCVHCSVKVTVPKSKEAKPGLSNSQEWKCLAEILMDFVALKLILSQ